MRLIPIAGPADTLSRDQALAMREACLTLPDTAAYSARTMLMVLTSYLRALDLLEAMGEMVEPVEGEGYDA